MPPLSLALRGGSLRYWPRNTVALANWLPADADLGTNKIGVWGLRPQRVQGRALAFSLPYLANLSAHGAEPPVGEAEKP